MAKIIIFGLTDFAQMAKYYFDTDSEHEVVAFTANKDYIKEDFFENLPILPFEIIESKYPPSHYDFFVAIAYSQMNRLREKLYHEVKNKGYKMVSYISSDCTYKSKSFPGDNCFIFEDNTIQPFVEIGNNVVLWSGNHIGHHSIIKDHNFISSHVVVSGHCIIESNCFLGVNSTIAHQKKIAQGSLIGAGSIITKNTEFNGIYVPPRTIKLEKNSDQISI